MAEGNLLDLLRAREADPTELEQLLLRFYGRSQQVNEREIWYGDERPALKVRFSKEGKITTILSGESFIDAHLQEIRAQIETQLLAPRNTRIGRKVFFSRVPSVGYFRFGDWFQLLPVPPDAPRPPQILGDHPLWLEVSYQGSSDFSVNAFRQARRALEVELVCHSLLNPMVFAGPRYSESYWVLDAPPTGGELQSSFRQGGYYWPQPQLPENEFLDVSGLPPMNPVDPQEYYFRSGIAAEDVLQVPANLGELLKKYLTLNTDMQRRFLNASYWFRHGIQTWRQSSSAAVTALVSAVEALIPDVPGGEPCDKCGAPQGPGPTLKFTSFVDNYAPTPDADAESRRHFYRLRSAISHGGKLLHADLLPWTMGFQQINESGQIRELSNILRAILVNWLSDK